ncbi:MAG: NlpC/P60 family protein [Romboutsia sp.]|uniref:C40 family peptidase n=1 Tax=Romboutsia sp. TaxID=1965302 RepID=UPI003F2E5DF6
MEKYVNVEKLNMRTGSGTGYRIITVISKGTTVEVISESNGWSKIKYNGLTGYVYSQYISVVINKPIPQSEVIKKAIEIAKSKLGCKYIWGAEGPNTFDCSGLIYYVFKTNLNIDVPRVSKDMSRYGKTVGIKDLQPGDLLFFDTDGVNDSNVTHVGMYLGNGEFIQASSGSNMKVVISKLEGYYTKQFVNAKRIV